jgi:hypothetical protein
MAIEIAFTLALVVLAVATYWIALKNSSEKIGRQFQILSERLELQLDQPMPKMGGFLRPEPSLYGTYRGREMSISVPGKGLQNTRQIETLLKIGITDKNISAQLTATGPLGGLRQRDSGKQARWKSGDEKFDNAVDVRTNHGEILCGLLGKERRKWLADTLERSKATLYIGGGNLAYARLGLIGNESTRQDFEAAAEFLCDLAETIETS